MYVNLHAHARTHASTHTHTHTHTHTQAVVERDDYGRVLTRIPPKKGQVISQLLVSDTYVTSLVGDTCMTSLISDTSVTSLVRDTCMTSLVSDTSVISLVGDTYVAACIHVLVMSAGWERHLGCKPRYNCIIVDAGT